MTIWYLKKNWKIKSSCFFLRSTFFNFYAPPFQTREGILLHCSPSVGRSVCHPPTFSVHFLRRGWAFWNENLVYLFAIIISLSSSILGTIKTLLTVLCPLDVEIFQLFAVVSVYFLCKGCTYWNEIYNTDLS